MVINGEHLSLRGCYQAGYIQDEYQNYDFSYLYKKVPPDNLPKLPF
jgi:hypothetical protein